MMRVGRAALRWTVPLLFRRRGLAWALWLLGSALLSGVGCGHRECTPGEQKCEGTRRMFCEEEGCHTPDCGLNRGSYWRSEACPDACVATPDAGAFCAASADKDPKCAMMTMVNSEYCDGNTRVTCFVGFALWRNDCEAAGRYCVASWPSALCAVSPSPDPRCDGFAGGYGTLCVGSSVAKCERGYLVSLEPCVLNCAAITPQEAFCASSNEPEPVCQTPEQLARHPSMCVADGVSAYCDRGYLRETSSCSRANSFCSARAYEAYCADPDRDAGGE